jgi:RND family efflux transporter MFP subunit
MQSPEFPDEVARGEGNRMSTEFRADTGRRVKRGVGLAAALLILCFFIVLIVRLFAARALAKDNAAAFAAPPPVDVITALSATVGQDLVLPGQTAAWSETTIYARVNGYVAKWLVDIGDRAVKGQILATIETPELDAELSAARAQLQASEAQVSARRAEMEFSRTTNERWRDSPKGVVSDQERQAKKADFEGSTARLYAAKAQVLLDQARVDQYAALAQFKQVTAPFDGTITERRIDVGNLVAAGSGSATTPLFRISQATPLRVFVDVPQASADELMSAGVPAEIRTEGPASRVFSAQITRTAQAINVQARTLRVEVDMPNTEHALVPGMYVNVAFRLATRGSVQVPAAALMFRAGGPQVARVGSDGKVSFVAVTIARDNGSLVELSSGVAVGDRLVLNISSQIAPGQVVAVSDTT